MSSFYELFSSGKSGNFFFYSTDGKYILKTLNRNEFKFIKSILKSYYNHIMENPKSLVPKFFGVHKLHFTNQKMVTNIGTEKVYFCVMSNIFGSQLEVHEMYDLKGSTYQRELTPEQMKHVKNKTAKIA